MSNTTEVLGIIRDVQAEAIRTVARVAHQERSGPTTWEAVARWLDATADRVETGGER